MAGENGVQRLSDQVVRWMTLAIIAGALSTLAWHLVAKSILPIPPVEARLRAEIELLKLRVIHNEELLRANVDPSRLPACYHEK